MHTLVSISYLWARLIDVMLRISIKGRIMVRLQIYVVCREYAFDLSVWQPRFCTFSLKT